MSLLIEASDFFVRDQVKKLIKVQFFLICIVSVSFLVFGGAVNGLSALAGGLIALVPTFLYGWRIGINPEPSPWEAYRGQIKGQIWKYFSTAIFFTFTFVIFESVNFLALFSSYIAALLVYWAALANCKEEA